jgi:hypothetical protein
MQAFLRPAGDRQAAIRVRTTSKAHAVQPGVGRARDAGEASLNFLTTNQITPEGVFPDMIRNLKSGVYRLYSRKKDAKTGKRKNLGTFSSRAGMSGRCSILSEPEWLKARFILRYLRALPERL